MYQAPNGTGWEHAIDIPKAKTVLMELTNFCNRFCANAYTFTIEEDKYRFFFHMKHHADAFRDTFSVDNPVVAPKPVVAQGKTATVMPPRDSSGRFVSPQAKLGIAATAQAQTPAQPPTQTPAPVSNTMGDIVRKLKDRNKPVPPQSITINVNGVRTTIPFYHLAPEAVEVLGSSIIAQCRAAEEKATPKAPNWTYIEYRSTLVRLFEVSTNRAVKLPVDTTADTNLHLYLKTLHPDVKAQWTASVMSDVFVKKEFRLSANFGPRDVGDFADWLQNNYGVTV